MNECSLLPIFNFVSPLHIINVHADFVVDVWWQIGTVATDVGKHDSSPELLVIQEAHGLVDQSLFISYWLQLIQIDTLKNNINNIR